MAIRIQKTDGGRESAGFAEKKDCTVRSLACAANIPYATAHDIARRAGRPNCKGWFTERIHPVAQADGVLEFVTIPLGVYRRGLAGFNERLVYPTVAQIARKYPKGRYILNTCNHATTLIDGEIHDTGVRPGAKVVSIWEVRLPEPKPAPPCTQAQVNELWERLNQLENRQ